MKNQSFDSFDFKPLIKQAVEQLHFIKPTEIQQELIPAILNGQSVIGQSQTGSGKTHAFLLPLFNQLKEQSKDVQLVLTAPTRELASQIFDEVKRMIQYTNKEEVWTAKLLIGGTDKQRMQDKLKTAPDIIVGTPGRILDMVESGAVSIFSATAFVIDEADLMLDMGFISDIDKLLVRSHSDVQLLVFSATIPTRLEHFFKKYLENPLYVKIDQKISPELMEHRMIDLRHRDAAKVIKHLSTVTQPYLAIIFTNGKDNADQLAEKLQQQGLDVGLLHGGLTPRQRKRVVKEIQNLRYQYVVCTDLASRGIDIKGVSHVINAQLPKEEPFYIHRSGRTARAGLEGTVISLYTEQDIPMLKLLEKRGLSFVYCDVKDGEWTDAKPWNKRQLRTQMATDLDKEAWKRVKKPTKVKPGYKKKMKKQQEAIKKQLQKKEKSNRNRRK